MISDKYMDLLAGYTSSKIQDFESYLRTEVDLVQDDIGLILYDFFFKFYQLNITTGLLFF